MSTSAKTISVTDLRVTTREVLENAHFRGRHYVVVRAGQPMAVILGIDEYRRLTDNRHEPAEAFSGDLANVA